MDFERTYAKELEVKEPLVLERAPEICVEVLSPTNSLAEMNEKRALYFEAGAHEVWICGLDGKMEFYTPDLVRGFTALPFVPRPIVSGTISFISVRLVNLVEVSSALSLLSIHSR